MYRITKLLAVPLIAAGFLFMTSASEAQAQGVTTEAVVDEILANLAVP